MSLIPCWEELKRQNPATPREFMQCVRKHYPELSEKVIISWQRASRDWTTAIFDFLWFYMQIEQGETKWIPFIQRTWPKIQAILETHTLDDLFKKMCL